MGWLKKKSDAGPFAGLPDEELAGLVNAYRTYASQALFGCEPMIVSPGSEESARFIGNLARLSETFGTKATNPDAVMNVAKNAKEEMSRFGGWQRAQAQALIEEFSDSLSGLADCCSGSLDSQDNMVESLKGVEERLTAVRQSNDIVQIRRALQDEVSLAHRTIAHHTKSRDTMRERLRAQVSELQERIVKAEQRAQTDHVTNLANRAALEVYAESIMHRVSFGEGPYCLAMFDIDGLRSINDKHGLDAGDGALNHVAGFLRRAFPPPAFVGRFGGDEFVVVVEGDPASIGRRVADIVADFGRKPLPFFSNGKTLLVSISASGGVADFRPKERLSQTLAQADRALQAAKNQGAPRKRAA